MNIYTSKTQYLEAEIKRLHEANQAMLEELENCVDLLVACFPDAPVDSCIGQAITKGNTAIAKGK
jgi:hypothetical protein